MLPSMAMFALVTMLPTDLSAILSVIALSLHRQETNMLTVSQRDQLVTSLPRPTLPCWVTSITHVHCHCDGFGYKHKIGTSPYFYINQRHIHLRYLHPFWTPEYFTVPPHERKQGKLRQPRALKGFFVGYSYSRYLQPCQVWAC